MVDKFLLVGLKADLPAVRDANKLYWCSDTRELYKGMDLYTEAVRIVSAIPATPAQGVLYVLPTGEAKVFNGTDTVTVAKPYVDSSAGVLTAANTDDQVATAKVVYDSITSAVSSATEDIVKGGALVNNIISTKAGTVTVTKGEYLQLDAGNATFTAGTNYFVKSGDAYVVDTTVDASNFAAKVASGLYVSADETDVVLKGVVVNPTYDASTRTITLPYADGTNSLVINLGKDIFLDPSAQNKYNPATGNIELYLNDANGGAPTMISIPASDLVDIYTGETSADGSTTVSVSSDNKITASVNVSADAGNKLVKKADGLYVDAVAQADFDALDNQVNSVQTQVVLKQAGTTTGASYTYSADDKFLVDGVETVIASDADLNTTLADTGVTSVVAVVGEDGLAKRLTTAEADIETNSEAIKQLKKDVDDTIANLEEIHLDPNADNKYDNTTGNINLYLNDGVTYEESIHYYDGMEYYKLGPNAVYYNSSSYYTLTDKGDGTYLCTSINDVTASNFAAKVAAGNLWVLGQDVNYIYPNVKAIAEKKDGTYTIYNISDHNNNLEDTIYNKISTSFEESKTFYFVIENEPTKIEVPVSELKAAITAIDTINTTLKDGIYVEVASTDKFDVNTTYFVLSNGEFVEDNTVSAVNFDAKVTAGLYVIASDAIELLAAKVDANAQDIATNAEAIEELSYVECTTNSVYVAGVTYYTKDSNGDYVADATVTDDTTLQAAVTAGNSYVKTKDAVKVNESRIAAIEDALTWGSF